ncbi:hypothetical protein Pth03_74380 [Planotetraspora thailandica]|uniref:Tyr recombinase domain-containing protein n=1 Tax=Planotetraspora thailandica TaxID=487172 RepID=A0A8J3Y1G0_9ACTN|nr:site-specific recombinase [Planotetraspora thailandica]GII59049.1 hypothetical protein Pth03_74380 [Planotetraspora thailandica]
MASFPAPVEYAVAVEHYLAALRLSEASRRVYRIALATWAWALVARTPPGGRERRGAAAPIVPMALLDAPDAGQRVQDALVRRAATADPRTVSRELSILRGAISWWRMRGWIDADPLKGVRPPATPPSAPSTLTLAQVAEVFALPAPLREQACWHLLYETASPIERVLALNADDLDLIRRRVRRDPAIRWGAESARLLPLLLAGRTEGPLFLTSRRPGADAAARDRCPITGRGRLSYRQAAGLFTEATRSLDPEGHGWTLRRLRTAGMAA